MMLLYHRDKKEKIYIQWEVVAESNVVLGFVDYYY